MAQLVIMRHGESTWTDKAVNRFAGWVDVPLTERGRAQARHAGELIAGAGLRPVVCMTSVLGRTRETADIVLDVIGRPWLSAERTWRLNERHYGAFQGEIRPAMRERFGDELFHAYRRSFDVRPPWPTGFPAPTPLQFARSLSRAWACASPPGGRSMWSPGSRQGSASLW